MNNTEQPKEPKVTATNSEREILDAITRYEVNQAFIEYYGPVKTDEQDLPF